MVNISPFGLTSDQKEAKLVTIERGKAKISVTNYGATLVSFVYTKNDQEAIDIVLGHDNVSGYETGGGSLGATVGRCANRISNAAFELNGIRYELDMNNGTNCLHSGIDRYPKRLFEIKEAEEGSDSVTFFLDSPDGDQRLPGHALVYVTYTLEEDARLVIRYKVKSDADTLCNFTNHSYFNLNGHDSGSVLSHTLMVAAEQYTPLSEKSVPTGEIRSVAGTVFDFREAKAVGKDLDLSNPELANAKGYDHNYCLQKKKGELKKAAVLTGNKGISMTTYTDLPGVQIYTANYLDREPGKNGAVYNAFEGICLETQYYPDAINVPAFASPILKKNEVFTSKTIYALEECFDEC